MDWITWYCALEVNDFFCKVDLDFIEEHSNLDGLEDQVPYFYQALTVITSPIDDNAKDLLNPNFWLTIASELLYGLIHARFINTSIGMDNMIIKIAKGEFGQCPRVFCEGQDMLPAGLSSIPGKASVTCFCPRCHNYYVPSKSRHLEIDGAYFGNFPDNFFLAKPYLRPQKAPGLYEPRLFGFKIHPLAYEFQDVKAEEVEIEAKIEVKMEEP